MRFKWAFKFCRGFKQVPLLGGAKPDLRKGLLRAILGITKEIRETETACSMPDKSTATIYINLHLDVCLWDNHKSFKAPTN